MPCNEAALQGLLSSTIEYIETEEKTARAESYEKFSSGGSGPAWKWWFSKWFIVRSGDAKIAVTALAVSLLFKSTLAGARSVPSASMSPTLDVGDHILAEKVMN